MADATRITPRELKPGRWQLTIEYPRERGGQRKRERRNFRGSAVEVAAEVRRLEREFAAIADGLEPSRLTLWQQIENTLKARRASGLMSHLTYGDRMAQARHHIMPHPIAGKLLARLRPDDLERFSVHLAGVVVAVGRRARPLAPGTRKNILGIISLATGAAARKQSIPHDPSRLVEPVRTPSVKQYARAVEAPTLGLLLGAIPAKQRRPYELALRTGLRRGEVCGLTFGDLDLNPASGPPVLHVRRSIQRRHGETFVLPTKTAAGVRTLPLSPDLVAMLRRVLCEGRRRALALGAKLADQPIFPGRDGGFMPPSTLTMAFRNARLRAGVEGVRLHDLRHTFVTQALRGTGNLALVSARAGHADRKVTLAIYSHVMDEDQARAVDPFQGVDLTGSPAPTRPLPKRGTT